MGIELGVLGIGGPLFSEMTSAILSRGEGEVLVFFGEIIDGVEST